MATRNGAFLAAEYFLSMRALDSLTRTPCLRCKRSFRLSLCEFLLACRTSVRTVRTSALLKFESIALYGNCVSWPNYLTALYPVPRSHSLFASCFPLDIHSSVTSESREIVAHCRGKRGGQRAGGRVSCLNFPPHLSTLDGETRNPEAKEYLRNVVIGCDAVRERPCFVYRLLISGHRNVLSRVVVLVK